MITTSTVVTKTKKNDPIFTYFGKGVLVNPFHQIFSSKAQELSQINTNCF